MNILYISPNSHKISVGGVERYLLNLIDYYKQQTRHNCIILLPAKDKNKTESSGTVTTIHAKSLLLSKKRHTNFREAAAKAHSFSKQLEEIIILHKVDVIVAENFHIGLPPAFSLMLNLVASKFQIPIVLRLHSFATKELQIQLVNQLMWKQISCVSKSVAGDCFQKGTDIELLETHYLGVNTEEFSESTDKTWLKKNAQFPATSKVVLTASRIILGRKTILEEKGILTTIRAFSKISQRNPDLRLVIAVGKAPRSLSQEFKHAWEQLHGYLHLHNIAEKTKVKKYSFEQMPKVYAGSDVFVLPSENETFGQVFIEAMASGTPVIGTKVGGIPEIISDKYNGFLIPYTDASLLAQRINTLIDDREIKEQFVNAAIQTVKRRFTLSTEFDTFNTNLLRLAQKKDKISLQK